MKSWPELLSIIFFLLVTPTPPALFSMCLILDDPTVTLITLTLLVRKMRQKHDPVCSSAIMVNHDFTHKKRGSGSTLFADEQAGYFSLDHWKLTEKTLFSSKGTLFSEIWILRTFNGIMAPSVGTQSIVGRVFFF